MSKNTNINSKCVACPKNSVSLVYIKPAVFMKKILPALLLLYPLILPAQSTYTIEGKIDSLKNGDKIYLSYMSENGRISDSSLVKDGRFVFKGNLKYPVNAILFLNKNAYATIPAQRVENYFNFFLEPARFTITSKKSFNQSIVKGSAINDRDNELKALLKPITTKLKALDEQFNSLPKEKHDSLEKRQQRVFKEASRICLAFIKKHPDSYYSLIRLSYIAGVPDVYKEAKSAFAHLSPELKKTPLGKGIVTQLVAPEITKIGKLAPDFEQNTPDGKKIKLSHFRSKYVLLDFWASWCAPCRQENPNVAAAYNQYKDKGFTVLGVSLDQAGQKDAWVKAIQKDQLTWHQVSDLKGWENTVAQKYGVRSIPANFLIDPKGKIIARDLRGKDLQDKLAQLFAGK
jgi:peroxiredoxin